MHGALNLCDATPYILNEPNMLRSLKYNHLSPTMPTQSLSSSQPTSTHSKPATYSKQDSLFWCYFRLHCGEEAYELLPRKNALTARHYKLQWVQRLREHKAWLKQWKIDAFQKLEENLSSEAPLSLTTFMALCAIDRVPLAVVQGNTFCEGPSYSMEREDGRVVLVKKHPNYGFHCEWVAREAIETLRQSLFVLDHWHKPLKCLSAYKVGELVQIASKLHLATVDHAGKPKTKQLLYQDIYQAIVFPQEH